MREGNNTVSNTSDTTFTYTDQQRDSESGLYYYNSRYYDPEIRRFTSVDPVAYASSQQELEEKVGTTLELYLTDPQGLNTYSYVRNNPITLIDPTGEFYDLSQH